MFRGIIDMIEERATKRNLENRIALRREPISSRCAGHGADHQGDERDDTSGAAAGASRGDTSLLYVHKSVPEFNRPGGLTRQGLCDIFPAFIGRVFETGTTLKNPFGKNSRR